MAWKYVEDVTQGYVTGKCPNPNGVPLRLDLPIARLVKPRWGLASQ
jgi:hypothetical protein